LLKKCCKKKTTVDPEQTEERDPKAVFLETERNKPPLVDFTLGEYTEKVIQYGFLVVSNCEYKSTNPLG